MFRCLGTKNRKKRGFTLMEVMVVVGIIAVIAAIAIPSVISMQKNMDYQQRCDYAKTIFLAAQSNLVELRSTGELDKVEDNKAKTVLQTNDGADGTVLPENFTDRYAYTFHNAGDNGLAMVDNPAAYYDIILPVNSVESVLRDQQVIIEYNPRTGGVYSVFYAEEYGELAGDYQTGKLQRNEKWLKDNLVGYYDGSDMTGEELGFYEVAARMSYENGQEGILTVEIPTQSTQNGVEDLVLNYESYIKALEIELTVIGENSGMFTKTIKNSGAAADFKTVSGGGTGGANVLQLTFTLDSLLEGSGFVNMAENQKTVQGAVTGFHVLPGDNISLSAEITFAAGENDPVIIFDDAVLAGVNPLFHSLTGDASSGYTLAVSNGRHLQNLNAMDPGIAVDVSVITFVNSDVESTASPVIDWKDTVDYYAKNNLAYFTPINNASLFNRTTQNSKTLTVDGNNVVISNLKINSSKTQNSNTYYADALSTVNSHVGLFSLINGQVNGLRIVNPVVRGGSGSQAVGVLAGSAGSSADITDCYVYVDTDAEDFSWNDLVITDAFNGTDTSDLQYGVIGYAAVGGMVGYSDDASFKQCFAAVPVFGNLTVNASMGNDIGVGGFVGMANRGSFNKCYSSVRTSGTGAVSYCGMGGFVGTSQNARFTNCFASGNVTHTSSSLVACGGFVGVMKEDGTARNNNALFDSCYALGEVRSTTGNGERQAKFVGTSDTTAGDIESKYQDRYKQLLYGKKTGYIYEGCYYLRGYNGVDNDVDTCTLPAGYNLLHDLYDIDFNDAYIDDILASLGKNGLTDAEEDKLKPEIVGSNYDEGDWTSGLNSKKNGHYPYMQGYKENGANYPYAMLTGMPFYGTWPDAPSSVGIGYWEMYEDGEFGIYYDQVGDTTLQNDTVAADGYLILSANDPGTPEVFFGESRDTRVIDFVGPVSVGGNSYYYGIIPADVAVSGSFYTKVEMNDKIDTYTMYFNPNTAATQVNPTGTNEEAKNPGTAAPDTLYIRTARQLAALGSSAMSSYWREDYVLHGDIDFSEYGIDASDLSEYGIDAEEFAKYGVTAQTMTSIGNATIPFTGTLTGVSGTTITVKDATSGLIGTLNGGTVTGITLNGSMSLDGAEGALVNIMNGGIISDCTVNAQIKSTGDHKDEVGLIAGKVLAGTISNTRSTGANSDLGFVGSIEENTAAPIDADATHYSTELCEDGSYTQKQIADKKLEQIPENADRTKRSYKATITDDCTYKKGSDTLKAVTYDPYYYSITGEDAYKADTTSAVAFTAAGNVKLSAFGTDQKDWFDSGYYFQILGGYFPVYVKVDVATETVTLPTEAPETESTEQDPTGSTGESMPPETQTTTTYTYTFGYPLGDSYRELSSPKSTQDPESVAITDMTLYSVSLPTSGTYILTNGTKVLTAAGEAEIGDTITENMIWTAGAQTWNNGENSIAVTLDIPSTGSVQYPMVTVNGAQYQVYAVSMNTDRDVELVDKNPIYSITKQENEPPAATETTAATEESQP